MSRKRIQREKSHFSITESTPWILNTDGNLGLFLALQNNCDKAIKALFNELASFDLSKRELREIVEAHKSPNDIYGLYLALINKYDKTYQAYMDGLNSLGFSQEEITGIIETRGS